jgi:phospholipid/cholesterol/gamma-HCH transport system substrate-binding protein
MEPDTRYTIIGAVMLGLVAAAVAGFLWLSSGGRASDFRFYTVYFEQQSLEGLQVGASVNMRGISVGRVESYTLSSDNINRVNVTLRVARETPVRQNTKAAVSRNVLTGIARINLVTRGQPGPELVAVEKGERYPVIPEGFSRLDQFTDMATKLGAVADHALENFNELLRPENQKAFSELLVSLRDLTRNLNGRLESLETTLHGVDQATLSFKRAADDISGTARTATQSIEPLARQADRTMQDVRQAVDNLSKGTLALEQELAAAVQRIEQQSSVTLRRADATLDIGMHELRATAAELRSGVDSIARSLERLQDPKAALIGPDARQLGPGEVAP